MKLPATRAIIACLLALAASAAQALPVVRKSPGGAWVVQSGPDFVVPAGQPISWSVRICNDTAAPMTASLQDYLHSGECSGHELQVLRCPPLTVGNGTVAACDDAASPPLVQPALDVQDLHIDPNQCADIIFETVVDLLAPVGSLACNVGVYATDAGTPDASGQTSPPSGSGCSCVVVTTPITTEMTLFLDQQVDVPPFVEGDAESTMAYIVTGENDTQRPVAGRFVLPIPTGLSYVETIDCPAGATCGLNGAGEFEISGLAVDEGGTFTGALRVQGNCASVGIGRICAQGYFEPIEDASRRILTGDPRAPAGSPTCIKPAAPALEVWKTYRLIDRDGNGTPSAGDRIRFSLTTWNRGNAPARDVVVVDAPPLGYDRSATGAQAVAVDPSGSYGGSQATWTYPEIGPASVVTGWVEATMLVDAVAPNRARLSSRVLRDCGIATVLSDNPLTAAADDATAVGPGAPQVAVTKGFSYRDLDGNGQVNAGDTINFELVLRNVGTAPALDVVLDDALPACLGDAFGVGIEPPDGGIDASVPRTVTVNGVGGPDGLLPDEVVVVRFSSRAGDPVACCNQASVTWAGAPTAVVSADPRGLDVPQATCLSAVARLVRLQKQATLTDLDGSGTPSPGDRIHYRITILNDGVPVPDYLLTDELPAEVAFDPASLVVSTPNPYRWSFAEPPLGLHGGGRLHVEPFDLGTGMAATVDFDVTIQAGVTGSICNQAGLLAAGTLYPRLSEDVTTGGATCVTVSEPQPPSLTAALVASGPLTEGCALAGEEVDLAVTVDVAGDLGALDVGLGLADVTGLSLVDLGGGAEAAGVVSWSDIGTLAPRQQATRTLRALVPCGLTGGLMLTPSAAASNAARVEGAPWTVTIASPVIDGSLVLTHDDTNADGVLDPGETILAEITITETASCDAGDVAVSLALDPTLSVVELRDGGVASAAGVDWTVPALAGGGTATVAVVIELAAGAGDCALPTVTPAASWLASPGTACLEVGAWGPGAAGTPPGPCAPPVVSDLLREALPVLDVDTLDALPSVLSSLGVDDTCLAGTVTRIAETSVVAVDVAAQLGAGVVVAGDAIPVGLGAGNLVFYEVSHSCASIRACKVDADGDPLNGRESVRIGTADCGP